MADRGYRRIYIPPVPEAKRSSDPSSSIQNLSRLQVEAHPIAAKPVLVIMPLKVYAGSHVGIRWRPAVRPKPSTQRCRSSSDSSGASTSSREEPQMQRQSRRHSGSVNVQQAAVTALGLAAGAIVGASAVQALFAAPAGAAQRVGASPIVHLRQCAHQTHQRQTARLRDGCMQCRPPGSRAKPAYLRHCKVIDSRGTNTQMSSTSGSGGRMP